MKNHWGEKFMLRNSCIIAVLIIGAVTSFAIAAQKPGTFFSLAFNTPAAGGFVFLALIIFWNKLNASAVLISVITGTVAGVLLYSFIPEHLTGYHTCIPSVVTLILFIIAVHKTLSFSIRKLNTLGFVSSGAERVSIQC